MSKRSYRKLILSLSITGILLVSIVSFIPLLTLVQSSAAAPIDWWDTDWPFRKAITIDHTKVDAGLANFPVLIDVTDSDLASKAQPDGDDIAFIDSDGIQLNHEIELYDSSTGRLVAWVNVPSLSSTTDTVLYMYYGNPAAESQESPSAVWDPNYMMVQHLSEKPGSLESAGGEPHQCRFWGMIADSVPREVVLDHLINMPYSLKNLGADNRNGWGLGYYNDTEPVVLRGQPPASEDPNFDLAAEEVASSGARIAVGHVRAAASGLVDIPNPHPFKRFKGGKWWLLGHNGVIPKSYLIELIGEDYLAENPPYVGENPSEWIDSELYFIYLLKCFEENNWNIVPGIAKAVVDICDVVPGTGETLNFFLTNGDTLWGLRKGRTLYYYYSASPQYSAIASQYPSSSQGDWVWLDDYNLVELTRDNPPLAIEDIREHYPRPQSFDSTPNGNNGTVYGGVVQGATGKIDGAYEFDGTSGYIEVPHDDTITGFTEAFTASVWIKPGDITKRQSILHKYDTAGNQRGWFIELYTYGTSHQFRLLGSADGSTYEYWYCDRGFSAGSWHYVVAVWKANQVPDFYVDGVKKTTIRTGTISQIYNNEGAPLHIGKSTYSSGREFEGVIDEARVSKIARSASWVLTCFNNQEDPSSFYTVGSEEVSIEAPVISGENPRNGATGVPVSLSELSFDLLDYQGDLMNYTVVTHPDIGSGSATNVGNGTYTVAVSSLAYFTTYTWQVDVTDGTHWTNVTYTFTTESGVNWPPTHEQPLLVSSGGTNTTNENLICYNQTTVDPDGDEVTNIYHWYRNDVSLTNLLMPFDTYSSTLVKDYSGYENDGTIYGAATWTRDGIVGGAYTLDGANGYIEIPDDDSLDGAGTWSELTLEVWIKISADQRGKRIVAKYRGYQIGFQTSTSRPPNTFYFGVWNTGYYEVEYSTPLSTGVWYHIVCVYKSGEGSRIFINGTEVEVTYMEGSNTGNIRNSDDPLEIGRRWDVDTSYFAGIVDEVRIYPTVLSQEQILQLYLDSCNGLSNSSTIVSQETNGGDVWKCEVTPNDSYQDGSAKLSNPLTIAIPPPILQHKWTVSGLPGGVSGVLIADIVGNGLEEVIWASRRRVTCLNGTDGSVIWTHFDSDIGFWTQPQMADLNRDGILEIIVPITGLVELDRTGILVLHGNNGSTYWRRTGLGGEIANSPVVCDIDGDGYPTIFVATMDISKGLNGEGRLTSLSYDGRILHQTFAWRPCSGGMSIADTDNDGEFEIYMGDRDMYYGDGGYGRGLRSFWARNLTLRWERPEILMSSHCPMLADVNGDGILEVIAGHQRDPCGIAIVNSTDGSIIREDLRIGVPIHYQSSVYDIDGDGKLELLMADGSHDYVYPTTYDVVVWDLVDWRMDANMYVGRCYYGPQVADVTGDGIMEIIACSYHGIHVFDRTYSLIDQVTGLSPWNPLNYAVVQDIDGDGLNEVVVSSQGGIIYAYDTPAPRPTPRARSEVQFYSERRLGVAEYVLPPGRQAPLVSAPSPSDGATDVPASLSQLSFTLTDYQGDLMNYTVTTYPDIGFGTGTNVGNARYIVSVSNLAYSTTYTWHVNVTDGTHWTSVTYSFTTEAQPAWWNTSWQYRKAVIIDHMLVGADLENFPVLIDVTDSDLASKAQPDGDDIAFTDDSGIQLSHEIELYDSGTGHLVAWVRVPSLSSTTYTNLYMYYGNPDAENQQNPHDVWDSHHMMVQHLNEASGTHYDSTSNGNDGTAHGGVIQGAVGKIDGADMFDGVNDHVEIPHSGTLAGFTEALTVSVWIKLDDINRRQAIVNKYDTTGNQRGWFVEYRLPERAIAFFASADGATYQWWYTPFEPEVDSWYHIAVVWEANAVPKFYINGQQVPTVRSGTIPYIYDNVGAPLHIGRSTYSAYRNFDGLIDEVRVSNPGRPAGWISTCFNNQKDPSSFYTIGSEEALPEEPIVSSPHPPNGATDVPVSLSELSFNLTDYQDLMNYTVVTYPDIGFGSGTNVGNGRYTISVSGLDYSTTYTWHVNVTDGTHWTNVTYIFTTEAAAPPLLVDSEFNDSDSSEDLRANTAGQDWYESRDDDPTLLTLDETDIGGNAGKKAAFAESKTSNAYLSQEFISPQTGTFSVQWDIYVDSILDISAPDRAGWMLIGDDTYSGSGPNADNSERFVYMAFYKPGGGTSGTMELVARDNDDGWTSFTTIATGLNLKQWYTIKVVCDLDADTYDVYVNGEYQATVAARNAKDSVTHISFAQWNDGAGTFYVDNVFSPPEDRYKLTINIVGSGSVEKDPAEATYAEGTVVTLTAVPADGWTFSGWSGDLTGAENPTTIVMDGDKIVTATFTEVPNTPPVIDDWYPAADPSILEGETQVFNVTYHDDEGDVLTVQWLLNGSDVGSGDEYTFTADYDDSGAYNVTVTVSDDEYSTAHTWWLTVTDVGPTLLMPFDSDEGSVAVDESGYGNNGTVYGAEWISDYGGCYLFNASESDYIEVPDDDSLDGGGTWTEITIEFWIKPTIDNKGVRLIEKRNDPSSSQRSYQVGFQTTPSTGISGNQLYFNVWTNPSGYKEIVAPFGLETGVWSHVICTYKDGVGMAIYVNGSLAVSASHSGSIWDSPCPLNIGRHGEGSSYFTGFMDDLRLYIKALPESLIQQHYEETKDSYAEVNHPPEIDSYYPAADPTILEGESQEFNVTYSDADGDPVTVQWYLNGTPTTTDDSYMFETNYTSAGVYNVTVVVSDGELSTKHEWTLTVVDVGPTLVMPFDSDESPVAVDESGYGNNGTVYGAMWVSDYGGCYLFNATEKDYIEVPDDDSLDGSGTWTEITVEFWIKPTIDNTGVRLIEKRSAGSSYQIGFQTTPSPGAVNQLYWNVWTIENGYKEIVSPVGLVTGKWSHVVCTYESGEGMKIYINGTLTVSDAHSGHIRDSTCPINIGRRGDDTSYFTGLMDDIRIYTKALPQPLIQQHYEETKDSYIEVNHPPEIDSYYPLTDPTILEGESQEFNVTYHDLDGDPLTVQWYLNGTPTVTSDSYTFTANYTSAGIYNVTVTVLDSLAEASHGWILTVTEVGPTLDMPFGTDESPTAVDYSGYGNNGTINGGATWTNSGDGSYHFDGADDYIVIPDDDSLDGAGSWLEITVEFWIRPTIDNTGVRIIAKRDPGNSYQVGFQTTPSPGVVNQLYWNVWTIENGYKEIVSPIGLVTGQWSHVVCTYKSGEGMKIYINGTLAVSDSHSGHIQDSGSSLYIGCRGGSSSFLTGLLDEVKIYIVSLPQQLILQQYHESKDAHGNLAPTIDSFSPTDLTPEVNEGESLQFTHVSSDPDFDQLTHVWLLDGDEQAATQNWTYSPSYEDAGTHNVTLIVSDGELFARQYWNVTVLNVNQAPTITEYYPETDPAIEEGESQEFNITCNDPDGDDLLIQWYLDNAPVGTTNSTSYTYTSVSAGTDNVTVAVSDGLAQVSHEWTLTVVEANVAPVVSNPEPSDLATDVPVSTSLLNFTISDADGDPMDYYVSTSPDVGSDSALGVADGTYSLPVSGLTYGTEYTWWVNVTDGTDWTNVTFTFTTEELLLVDSEFDDSVDSADLRANATAQDWYESRFDVPELLTLNDTDIGGNAGKKAALENYGIAENAYLTQEFSSAQTGIFTVSFDIYIDKIEDVGGYDRAGHIFVGDDSILTNAPTGTSNERFVCMVFYDSTPGDTGDDLEIRARTLSGQSWGTTSAWVQVATDLSYDTWYTIKIVLNVTDGTFDVYVDGVLSGDDIPKYNGYASSSVTHISFTADSDGRGAFYVDNVFSPAIDRYKLTVNIEGSGSVDVDPGESSYASGAEVTLTAVPADGWTFSEWSGDLSGSVSPAIVIMDGDKTVNATFTIEARPEKIHLTWQLSDTAHTITVTWETSRSDSGDTVLYDTLPRNGDPQLYGYSAQGTNHSYPEASGYIHDVELTGLTPDAVYYFICGGDAGGWSSERAFRTAPSISSDVRFVVGGDSRTNWTERTKISEAMANFNPAFVMHAGDMVADGRVQSQWDGWFTDVHDHWIGENNLTIPIIPVLGNHEFPNDTTTKYFVQFALPGNERWYSYDWGPDIHIICLDSESSASGDELTWLQNDLAAHANYTWKLVIFHKPPFVSGNHDPWEPALTYWVPLFDEYHVDIVFNGHEHSYQRTYPLNWTASQTEPQDYSNGTMYIVSGGWGAPLYTPEPIWYMAYQNKTYHFVLIDVFPNGTLHIQAKDDTGITFDEVRIYKQEELLVDSEFNDSVDSADLRDDDVGQDWYESRNDDPTLLTLDTTDVGGDATKKAKFTGDPGGNAYVTQEFSSPQSGVFTVQWDIYIDEILDISGNPDRAGWMLIGDDSGGTNGPNSASSERFVYMAFFKDGGGSTGTMDLVARQPGDDWGLFSVIASGLNLTQWYTIKVVCNITAATYGVYIDGEFVATVNAYIAKTSVTHMSFAQWNDGAGTFYVDNVFSPAQEIP